MNNFANIDQNRIATSKQQYAVAGHFAAIQAKTPSERFGLTKVFYAIMNKFYSESDSKMTHGDVQNYFEHDVVPQHFVKAIKKPKASKKVSKTQPKPKAPAKNSVAQKTENRITSLEIKVDVVAEQLGAILAILQK